MSSVLKPRLASSIRLIPTMDNIEPPYIAIPRTNRMPAEIRVVGKNALTINNIKPITKAAIPEIAYLWDSLTRIQSPALVLRGEHSPILDDEISARMVESLPNGRLHVFKDTGHSLPRLRPEEFAAVL
ncbi:MAG: alpha/beta hydrolase fold protein, partial [Candidatus Woesebacteria bacterium GW2011_GWA2_40_7b]